MKYLVLFLIGNVYAFNNFNPQQLIELNEINTNINYVKNLAEDKLNTPLDSLNSSSIIKAQDFNDFFNQFKNFDNNHNIIDFQPNTPITATQFNANFQEVKRIVEDELYFKSCLDILNKGYSEGSQIYTIDLDALGPQSPINVYCDMDTDGGGWTTIVKDYTTDLNYLSQFGSTNEISSTFYSNSNYGIGWGNANSTVRTFEMDFDYDEVYITYSGFYNSPSGSMGKMYMRDTTQETNYTFISLRDAHTNYIEGQSLTVGNNNIFTKQRTNINNRTDILNRSGNHIEILVSGYSGYPFGKRYINKLMFR